MQILRNKINTLYKKFIYAIYIFLILINKRNIIAIINKTYLAIKRFILT